jgi:hypothetical protein
VTERLPDAVARLIAYVYPSLGTRTIAQVMGIDHDLVADALARGAHLQTLDEIGMTEAEWKASLDG